MTTHKGSPCRQQCERATGQLGDRPSYRVV